MPGSMGRRIFRIRVQREFSLNALAELYEVSLSSRYPNSPIWIRSQHPCRRNLRRRKHFTHLEIADANKLLRFASTLCPDIPVDVLDQPNHHPKRLMIRFGEATELPVLEQIQPVVHSHP